MGGEIQTINPTTLADTIRDQVRKTIAATIPDEQINVLIKAEFDNYFKTPEKRYSNDPQPVSQFVGVIAKEMDVLMREKITAALRTEIERYTVHTWNTEGKKIVEQFVKEYAPHAIAGISESIVRGALQQLQNGRTF